MKTWRPISKTDSNAGCGFAVFNNDEEIATGHLKLGEHCSVFQAELLAIRKAIDWSNDNYTNKEIAIIIDSASAMALLQAKSYHPIATGIHEAVIHSPNHFHISWTRAHQGTHGNDRADAIAKQASTDNSLPFSYNKINIRAIKGILWQDLLASWQDEWNHNDSITFNFIPDIKDFLTLKWYTPNHHFSQFLTNHGRFFTYLARFKGTTNPSCTFCGTSDGSTHYTLQCPLLELERLHLNTTIETHDDNWPLQHLDSLFKYKDTYSSFFHLISVYFKRTPVPDY
ncbi:uncharacterized protein [Centruroides vittatus]|uniref:uncharacterized protein n=1 Tax=Centruroides vittatus TaxID=120091 RepID=UPI00350FB87B